MSVDPHSSPKRSITAEELAECVDLVEPHSFDSVIDRFREHHELSQERDSWTAAIGEAAGERGATVGSPHFVWSPSVVRGG